MIPLAEHEIIVPYKDDGKLNKEGESLFKQGEKMLKEKKLGVVILSGGEGTRLGLTYPKGLFKIEGMTLFDWHIKRLQALHEKYGSQIYLFIMTSDSTDKAVKEAFANSSRYPFLKGIEIFKQSSTAALEKATGNKLYRDGSVIMCPTGNGDFFEAISKVKSLKEVDVLNVISVDNVLANILDEVYVGAFFSNGLEVLSKAIKAEKNESVGAFFRDGEHIKIEEYSEAKTRDGVELFGNICNHLFSRDFIYRVKSHKMPLHEAYKKIPYTNEKGELVKPSSPNGIKREKFIFDSFELTTKNGVVAVPRSLEFAPLKNSVEIPTDNPLTCAMAIKNSRIKPVCKTTGPNPTVNTKSKI